MRNLSPEQARALIDVSLSCLRIQHFLNSSITWKSRFTFDFPEDVLLPLASGETWKKRYVKRYNANVYACEYWNCHSSFYMRQLFVPVIRGIRKICLIAERFVVLTVHGVLLYVDDKGPQPVRGPSKICESVKDFASEGTKVIARLDTACFIVVELSGTPTITHFATGADRVSALTSTSTWCAGALNSTGELVVVHNNNGNCATIPIPTVSFSADEIDDGPDEPIVVELQAEYSLRLIESVRKAESETQTHPRIPRRHPRHRHGIPAFNAEDAPQLGMVNNGTKSVDVREERRDSTDPVIQIVSRSSDCLLCISSEETGTLESDLEVSGDLVLFCLTKKGHLLFSLVDSETLKVRHSEQIDQIHDILRPGERIVQIASHSDILSLLTSKGHIFEFGFLVLNDQFAFKDSNVIIPIVREVAKLASGYLHNIALTSSGALYTWGLEPLCGAASFGLGTPTDPNSIMHEFYNENESSVDVSTSIRINCPRASYIRADALCTVVICDNPRGFASISPLTEAATNTAATAAAAAAVSSTRNG